MKNLIDQTAKNKSLRTKPISITIFCLIVIIFSLNFIIFTITFAIGQEVRNVNELNLKSNSLVQYNSSPDQIWQNEAQNSILNEEYNISFDGKIKSYQSPNRNNNIRFIYHNDGFTAKTRQTKFPLFDESNPEIRDEEKKYKNIPDWQVNFQLTGFTRSDHLNQEGINYFSSDKLYINGNKAFSEDRNIRIDYTNTGKGMRQDFTIKEKPPGEDILKLVINTGTQLRMNVSPGNVSFKTGDNKVMMRYSDLKVYDANGKILKAYFKKNKNNLNQFIICVNDKDAQYPITIDPITTSPLWTAEGDQTEAIYGFSVASAGDVNNDGYSDVIIGAPYYDNGQLNEGRAFVYYGSSVGLPAAANWTAEGDQEGGFFGWCVASAGDIDNNGCSDVIIGAIRYDNGEFDEGKVFVWYGDPVVGLGSNGTPGNADWNAESNEVLSLMGYSAHTAGDVNGDGFDDIIVGAIHLHSLLTDEVCVFVWYGSAGGLGPNGTPSNAVWTVQSNQETTNLGFEVTSAGDVNGDGYSDVIVGAFFYDNGEIDEGKVFVWYGAPVIGLGPNGIPGNEDWSAESNQAGAIFGYSVASAGDVNGDGYDDVIIGASGYDNVETDEGKVFVYPGSNTGLTSVPVWTAESNQEGANLGNCVASAGDANCDGKSDVIAGAWAYDHGETDEGSAFIWFSSSFGVNGTPANANWSAESNQDSAYFGLSVSTAGDVNSDDKTEVIVGAYLFDNGQTNSGKAYVYTVCDFPLPVELSSFTSSVNNNNVQLNWTTASETNNSGFDIERRDERSEAQDVWNQISFINGHGTTTSPNNYEFTDRNLASGKYNYRLKQTDFNGNFEYHNLSDEVVIEVPEKFELAQNYPNPFNPSTVIRYSLSENSFVTLKVYDVTGNEVATLVSEKQNSGTYNYQFSTVNNQLSSGVYFYKIQAGNFSAVKRMLLIK